MKKIQVEGQGIVAFPDEMADEEIRAVIKRKFYGETPKPLETIPAMRPRASIDEPVSTATIQPSLPQPATISPAKDRPPTLRAISPLENLKTEFRDLPSHLHEIVLFPAVAAAGGIDAVIQSLIEKNPKPINQFFSNLVGEPAETTAKFVNYLFGDEKAREVLQERLSERGILGSATDIAMITAPLSMIKGKPGRAVSEPVVKPKLPEIPSEPVVPIEVLKPSEAGAVTRTGEVLPSTEAKRRIVTQEQVGDRVFEVDTKSDQVTEIAPYLGREDRGPSTPDKVVATVDAGGKLKDLRRGSTVTVPIDRLQPQIEAKIGSKAKKIVVSPQGKVVEKPVMAKEPWQMTELEFLRQEDVKAEARGHFIRENESFGLSDWHRMQVAQAILDGKPVSSEVIKGTIGVMNVVKRMKALSQPTKPVVGQEAPKIKRELGAKLEGKKGRWIFSERRYKTKGDAKLQSALSSTRLAKELGLEGSWELESRVIKNPKGSGYLYEYRSRQPKPEAGTTLYSGIPIPEMAKALQDISASTKEVLGKAQERYGRPTGQGFTGAISSMWEHHKSLRDSQFVSMQIKKGFDKFGFPEERQKLITDVLESPTLAKDLTPQERGAFEWLKIERDKVSEFAVKSGLLSPEDAKSNYVFHWWINPVTGQPYFPMYGKVNPNAPQLKPRSVPTYRHGEEVLGLQRATSNPAELIGKSMEALTRAASSRSMLATLKNTEADIPGKMYRAVLSTEPKPLRIIEGWSKLSKQGLTEGYTKFDNWILDKPIAYKDMNGNLRIIKGAIGVQNELHPYLKAYMENPTYGRFARLNFGLKALKLMSGFHVLSLNWQALAGGVGLSRVPGFNVVKGLKMIKEGGEDLRGLFRNGLELKGYADVPYNALQIRGRFGETMGGKVISGAGTAVQKFTFDVIHPGIKTFTAKTVLDDMVARQSEKFGRPLTPAEKEPLYQKTVHYVDRLFSGEDYRTALLHTNQWMAKYFYSPEWRKGWQIALISPQWQKAHLGILGDITKSIFSKEGRKAPDAYLYRKYLYSALSIYATANLYNWVTTKQMDGEGRFMVQNEGHNSFSVRAPYNDPDGRRVFWRPLKSIFEIPELLSDPIGRVISKVAPIWGAAASQARPVDWRKYQGWGALPTRIKDFLKDISPLPTATVFEPSKALPSKILSPIGLPSSKGRSESQIKKEIEENIKKGNMDEVSRLISELVQVSTGGIEYRLRQNLGKSQKRIEKAVNQ